MRILSSSIILVSFFVNLGLFAPPTLSVDIQDNQAVIDYPEQITFSLKASGDEVIEDVELIFGTDVITCGDNLTRAFPEDYQPTKEVDVEWEWTLRRSGALPPGTQVWWEWKLTDEQGSEFRTPRQTMVFTDESIPWQTYYSDSLEINWIDGNEAFARELANAGEKALDSLFEITGVEIVEVVRVYIYPNSEEMQTATLFAPDWSGGIAFPPYRTVLAGVSPSSLSWGREVVAHELTHVLIGVYTFSCVSDLPTWLDEGLAMYGESSVGTSHADDYTRLEEAVENDTLLTVREVSGIFSNDPDLARQAYAQSLSLVEFLIEEYDQEDMLALLDAFSDGYSQDQALSEVYGLDQDSLYTAWREYIGAAPLKGTPVPKVTPTRTPFPTMPPITGPSAAATLTPTAVEEIAAAAPTATKTQPEEETVPEVEKSEPARLPLMIVGGGVLVVLIVTGVVLITKKRSTS